MSEKQKILICGDVEGKFNTLFTRVTNINNKSGPFDMLLCVGNFFGINNTEFEDYTKFAKSITVPTYILGPNKEEHLELYPEDITEFCPNLYYLGKRGVFNSGGGLKIAYLSGVPTDESTDLKDFEFNKQDVIALRDMCVKSQSNFRGVDILLTSVWPQNVNELDNKKLNENINGSPLISWLAANIKPRYHISGLEGIYYERAPYRNISFQEQERGEVATRFIGIARVGNPKKQKWIYAVNLTPVDRLKLSDLYQQTTDETEMPYDATLLSIIPQKKEYNQYFYNMNESPNKRRHDKESNSAKKRPRQFDQSHCWFCLSSPSVEKHLVISIGDQVYLALAKGGLVDMHLLILPVTHHQSLLELQESAVQEINKFKDALEKFFQEFDQVPIYFERNFKTSHMQIQVVPVPKRALKQLPDFLQDEAQKYDFTLNVLEQYNRLDQVVQKNCPYFWIELPDATLYTTCKKEFPLQFGRMVLASGIVLNMPDRSDWKTCVLPRTDEERLAQRIRRNFEPYDFTL